MFDKTIVVRLGRQVFDIYQSKYRVPMTEDILGEFDDFYVDKGVIAKVKNLIFDYKI